MIRWLLEISVKRRCCTASGAFQPTCSALLAACLFTIAANAADAPVPAAPTPAAPPVPAATPVSPTPAADLPSINLEPPALPTDGRTVKPTNKRNTLWEYPEREIQIPAGVIAVEEQQLTSPVFVAPTIADMTQGDPVDRAILLNALTNAESFLDGLGGIPDPFASAFPSSASSVPGRVIKLGPVIFQPNFNLGIIYEHSTFANDSGSQSSNGRVDGDAFLPTVGARINVLLGEPATGHTLSAVYAIQYTYDQRNSDEGNGGNAQPFNQQLSIAGRLDFTKLRLGLGISYDSLSGANRDFGGKVNRQLLTLSLTSSYDLTPKTSVNLDFIMPIRQISGGIDSTELSTAILLNHIRSPKLEIGLGLKAGTENRTGLETQTFEQMFVRSTFKHSPHVTIFGTLGFEHRVAGGLDEIAPIFTLGAEWRIREGTTLRFVAAQTIQNSGSISDANYRSTSGIIGLSQRLGSRTTLDISFGAEHAAYGSTQAGENVDRTDELYSAQMGLTFALGRRWSATLAYVYSSNDSSTNGFEISRGQFQVMYQF